MMTKGKKPAKPSKRKRVPVSLYKLLDKAGDSDDMHKITKVIKALEKGRKAKHNAR